MILAAACHQHPGYAGYLVGHGDSGDLGGAPLYGVLLACFGASAVGGTVLLPKIKTRLGANATVKAATVGFAGVIILIALAPNAYLAGIATLLAGVCWISVVSTLNVSAQVALPNWVRARGLSIFMMVFFGSMTVGRLTWGNLASHIGNSTTLILAAVGALIAIPLTRRAKLNQGETTSHRLFTGQRRS